MKKVYDWGGTVREYKKAEIYERLRETLIEIVKKQVKVDEKVLHELNNLLSDSRNFVLEYFVKM